MKHLWTLAIPCLGLISLAQAQTGSLFKDPEFQKRFMGSYGLLPDVEPPLNLEDEDQKQYFTEIREMLAADNMAGLKAKLLRDMDPTVSHASLQFMLANIFLGEGNDAAAVKWYQSAIKKFPSFLRAHKNLGLAYYQTGDTAKASEALSKSIELGDRAAQTSGLLGLCHVREENWQAAESALRHAIALEPDEKKWQRGLRDAYVGSEQWDAALGLVNQQLEEEPDNDRMWIIKGTALALLQRPDEATRAYETLRHMGKADAKVLESLGTLYMEQEKPNAALSAYLAAAKASKKLQGKSVLTTANVLFNYQHVDQAKRYVSQLKPRRGELTDAEQLELRTLEAKIARSEGNHSSAMTILKDIITQDNRNGDARIELAQLYEVQAKEAEEEIKRAEFYSRAKLLFEEAMKVEDSEAMAALRYGQMLVGKNDYAAAVPLLKRSYEKRQNDNVDQYIKRVERAARRQQAKEEELKKATAPKLPKA